MLKDQMEHIYRTMETDKIPWHFENPPKLILDLLASEQIKPCKAIELGCGVGNYVLYLAGQGFDATGVDFSEAAIEIALNASKEKGLDCRFFSADVLGDLADIPGTYVFVYDWELMHHIFPDSRKRYLTNVSRLLDSNGYYLSVFFSEESPQFGGQGKYRKTPIDTELYFSSEDEMKQLYEPQFKLIELKTVDIEGKSGDHKAIYALLKKRVLHA
jgi:cyclopropane fatty-acyl-phospholipid synthase-like methyltransferase